MMKSPVTDLSAAIMARESGFQKRDGNPIALCF
jgi:hypothetical protein